MSGLHADTSAMNNNGKETVANAEYFAKNRKPDQGKDHRDLCGGCGVFRAGLARQDPAGQCDDHRVYGGVVLLRHSARKG